MRWTQNHSQWLAKVMAENLCEDPAVKSLKDKDQLTQAIYRTIQNDFEREKVLEEEVRNMLDDLEKEHGSSFDRQKMYSMLKKKLAEKRGLIL